MHKLTTHRPPKRLHGPRLYWPICWGQFSDEEEGRAVRVAQWVIVTVSAVGMVVGLMAW